MAHQTRGAGGESGWLGGAQEGRERGGKDPQLEGRGGLGTDGSDNMHSITGCD